MGFSPAPPAGGERLLTLKAGDSMLRLDSTPELNISMSEWYNPVWTSSGAADWKVTLLISARETDACQLANLFTTDVYP
jgi:hypothetical protein